MGKSWAPTEYKQKAFTFVASGDIKWVSIRLLGEVLSQQGFKKKKVQSHLRLSKSQVNVLLWTGRARLQRHVKLPGMGHRPELHSSDDSLSPEQRRGGPRLVP